MHIIGAGMAGLLAGAMLRTQATAIYEAQPDLPHNHSAVLRFRSSVVGDLLNIPFKSVGVLKSTMAWRNPVADAMAYSRKTNGSFTLRSSLTANSQMSTRYVAPTNLISQMEERVQCPINYNQPADDLLVHRLAQSAPVISTVPMNVLMDILSWDGPRPDFRRRSGLNIVGIISDASAYCSLYVPDPTRPYSRLSMTGNQFIIECDEPTLKAVTSEQDAETRKDICRDIAEAAMADFGLTGAAFEWEAHPQTYAKILPVEESVRREFVMWASREHNVYSLGRFATWRPKLLVDDLVNDVRTIQRLAQNGSEGYPHTLKA